MAYVIVNFWPYLAASAAIGVGVGWWATGSRRGEADPSPADEGRVS
jgi:hypothetical protein